MISFESERFEAIIFNQTIQKVSLLGRRKEFMTKVTKSNKGWRECSQKLMSLSPIFSMPIFYSTEFSILCISCGSDNVKVTTIKTHPRGFLCVYYSHITSSKVTFFQRDLLVPVYLYVKVNVFNLLQLSSHIYKYIHRYIFEHIYTNINVYMYMYIYIYNIYIYCHAHCSSSSMSTLVLQDLHLI